jgi:cell division protein FtsZ
MTLYEVDEAANRIREEVDPEANIIFGSTFNKELEGKIRVSVVATGIEHEGQSLKPTFRAASSPIKERLAEPVKTFGASVQTFAVVKPVAETKPPVAVERSQVVASVVDPSYETAVNIPEAPAQQERPSWLQAPAPAVVVKETPKVRQRSLFSRMAALAGFTDDEVPSHTHHHAPQIASSMFVAQSQPERIAQQPQPQQASFEDDLLDTPAYLRRRAAQ